MSRLTGKVAVVTGASKGIGGAIAKKLGAEGASVVVNYASDKAGAEKTAAAITKAGGKAVVVHGSVDKSADVERLFTETEKAFGKADILVNNAGVYLMSPLDQISDEHFDKQFLINVRGPIVAAREAAKHFSGKGGSIINVSSVVSEAAFPGLTVYSATKAALDSVTRVLAAELGPQKIRVNSVNPGMIETEGATAAGFIGSDFQKQVEATAPLRRIGQPDEVADVVAFLASDDARWVTGEALRVSGGSR